MFLPTQSQGSGLLLPRRGTPVITSPLASLLKGSYVQQNCHNLLIFLQVKLEVGEEVLVLDTTDQDKWQVRIVNQRKEGRFSLNYPNG